MEKVIGAISFVTVSLAVIVALSAIDLGPSPWVSDSRIRSDPHLGTSVDSIVGLITPEPQRPVTAGSAYASAQPMANPIPYPVSFTESGLPPGTDWWVILAGVQRMTNETVLTIDELNGSYVYSVATSQPWEWWPSPCNGTVAVDGGPATLRVAWNRLYTLEFDARGTPPGTNWSVTVVGNSSSDIFPDELANDIVPPNVVTSWSDGADSIEFYVVNGTYSYSYAGSGLERGGGDGLVVAGENSSVSVSLLKTPTALSCPSAPGGCVLPLGVAGAAVVGGLALAWFAFRRKRST